MSTPAFTRFLKYKIIPIIVRDLRPLLNEMTQYFTFANPTAIKDTLKAEYGVDDGVAKAMLAHIEKSAREHCRGPKAIFTQQWINGVEAFATRDHLAVKRYKTKSGRVTYGKGTYGIVDRWKNKLNTKFNTSFKMIDWNTPVKGSGSLPRPISSLLVFGHGISGKQLAAVAQRGVKATGRIKAYSEHEWTKEANVKAAKETILKLGSSPQFEDFNLTGIVEKHLTPRGDFKVDYMVGLEIQSADANVSAAAGERTLYSTKLQEAIMEYALEGEASPSSVKMITNAIDAAVLGKKIKKVSSRGKSSKITYKGRKKATKAKAGRLPALRTSGGQFTSVMGIQAILDAKIKETVADNMGKGGALVYRTGRFASSVGVEKVMQSRQGTLTAFYTYMKAPYQTFERGFKQGSLRRDPRKLISASIREIARENLSHKLHIRTRRV